MTAALRPKEIATQADSLPPLPEPAFTHEPIYRLSIEQYHAMIAQGILTTDDRCELLEGALIYKMSVDEFHAVCTAVVQEIICAALPSGWNYRNQGPLALDDSEPEPDGAIVRGELRTYLKLGRKPGAGDTALVIEIANSSLARDRSLKQRIYARNGIQTYWIINLIDRQIEAFTDPDNVAETPKYRQQRIARAGEQIPLVLAGVHVADISVDEMLLTDL